MGDFYQSDNTGAFDNNFITIELIENPLNIQISRAEFIVGCLCKSYTNPTFPLRINFTPEELQKLSYVNVGYLRVYDWQGRPLMAEGSVTFKIRNGVFCNG